MPGSGCGAGGDTARGAKAHRAKRTGPGLGQRDAAQGLGRKQLEEREPVGQRRHDFAGLGHTGQQGQVQGLAGAASIRL